MTTNQNTFDTPLFRRPSLVDFNDCQKENDPNAAPPNPTTDPSAEEYNTMQLCIVAMGQMIPVAEVCVVGGASPTIATVLSPVDTINGQVAKFTLTRVSAGIVWVELTTNTLTDTLPALIGQPRAFVNASTDTTIGAVYGTGPAFGNPAVKVTTFTAGSAADASFTVIFR
jgi:hypothetical protein